MGNHLKKWLYTNSHLNAHQFKNHASLYSLKVGENYNPKTPQKENQRENPKSPKATDMFFGSPTGSLGSPCLQRPAGPVLPGLEALELRQRPPLKRAPAFGSPGCREKKNKSGRSRFFSDRKKKNEAQGLGVMFFFFSDALLKVRKAGGVCFEKPNVTKPTKKLRHFIRNRRAGSHQEKEPEC